MKALKILLDERKQQLDIFEQNKELGNPNESNYIVLLNEAIKELEELENKDRLAELEKVILDYYLAKGYQIGADGLGFKVRITTLYQWKLMHVILLYPTKLVFQVITETPKEMFDKAFEHFNTKGLYNDDNSR